MANDSVEWIVLYSSTLDAYLEASSATDAIAIVQQFSHQFASQRLNSIDLTTLHTSSLEAHLRRCSTQENCVQTAVKLSHFLQHCLQALEQNRTTETSRDITQRKQTEADLENSEARYRQIVETANEGIWILDALARTTFVNAKMANMLGYQIEEMLGMPLFAFMDEEGQAIATVLLERRRNGIAEQHEFKFQHRDGSVLWTLVSTNAITNAAGQCTGMLGMITDISDRKALELSLKDAEFQLKAMLNHAHAAIISLRVMDNGDCLYDYISAGCERLYGYTAEEFMTDPLLWRSLVFSEDLAGLLPSLEQLSSQHTTTDEFRIQHKDGNIRWISTSRTFQWNEIENCWNVTVVDTDVTRFKQIEIALRLSEERYRAAVEDQTELICRFLPDGRLTLVNSAYCRYFGRSEAELVGSNFLDLVPVDEQEQVKQCLQELCTLTPENDLLIQEHWVTQPNGQIAWQEWTNRAIFDSLGQLLEFQAVGRDMSDRKRAESALQQLNQELEQRIQHRTKQLAQELQRKEVLLREVHHRVKNNLQVITSMLRLQAQSTSEPLVQSALQDSQRRVRAIALTHELLYQTTDLSRIAFNVYTQRLCSTVLSIQSTHTCPIQILYQLQPVFLDLQTAISCGLLLNELVTNAVKHAFSGRNSGEIQIVLTPLTASKHLLSSERDAHQQQSNLLEETESQYYRLVVQDNGVGIPPTLDIETLESLGLRIAHDLARQLRGTLELVRAQGTCFQLIFPKPDEC